MENVYFFKSGNKVKIGKTKDVGSRLDAIRTSCPEGVVNLGSIRVVDSSRLEIDLHTKFRDKWTAGEWFEITEQEVSDVLSEFGEHMEENAYSSTRQDYDGRFWKRTRIEYESSGMTLKDFAKFKNIKLGTLKSRKSRERWNDAVVSTEIYINSKVIDEVPATDKYSDLIIDSIAVVIDADETEERKMAARLILDHLIPEWREMVAV